VGLVEVAQVDPDIHVKKKKKHFWCLDTSKRSLILMGFGVQILGILLGFERLEEESAIRKAMGFGFGVVG
jgi:hypothetical protein